MPTQFEHDLAWRAAHQTWTFRDTSFDTPIVIKDFGITFLSMLNEKEER
jgi:hypothetical protein